MASIIDPKISPSGEVLNWDPTQIPCTKPFVHIVTSPSGTLITEDDMNKSSISPAQSPHISTPSIDTVNGELTKFINSYKIR